LICNENSLLRHLLCINNLHVNNQNRKAMSKFTPFLLLVAALAACKKDSVSGLSRTDLLTTNKWRLTAQTMTVVNNGTTTVTDEYAKLAACQRDNFTQFNSDNTLVINEGGTTCSPQSPQTWDGDWEYVNGDQNKLLFSAYVSSYRAPFDILELSATTLRLRFTQSNGLNSNTNDVTLTAF
jgi:hypothetical protein